LVMAEGQCPHPRRANGCGSRQRLAILTRAIPRPGSMRFRTRRGPTVRCRNNTRGSVDINANQAARYYDVTLSNPGTITLDVDPQIDNLSIMGAQSQLVIGGPSTLQAR